MEKERLEAKLARLEGEKSRLEGSQSRSSNGSKGTVEAGSGQMTYADFGEGGPGGGGGGQREEQRMLEGEVKRLQVRPYPESSPANSYPWSPFSRCALTEVALS